MMQAQEKLTKKSYGSPKLLTYGTFGQLTKGTPAGANKDGGMMPNNKTD